MCRDSANSAPSARQSACQQTDQPKRVYFGCDGASQILHPSNVVADADFVERSKLPAITATVIQLSYLKLNSCKQTNSE